MAKGDAYTIGFAAVVCVACSLLLSGTSALLKQRQDAMVELDRKRNVLKAFGEPVTDETGRPRSAAEVDRVFAGHIREIILDGETGNVLEGLSSRDVPREELEKKQKLPLYRWEENGRVTRTAFPISGKGLWSTIYGYMALDESLSRILGVTFYRHGETPGLGGEIATDEFQQRFTGKRVFKDGQLQRIEVVKGAVATRYPEGNDHAVDGISGATLTGRGLNQFINQDVERYERYFSRQRAAMVNDHGG